MKPRPRLATIILLRASASGLSKAAKELFLDAASMGQPQRGMAEKS
jgi:hypothetical protein